MKITNKVVGTGFTARVVTTYSDLQTDDDLRFALDQISTRAAGSRHPFLDYLDAIEADAREELRRHGLPDEIRGYCKDDGGDWVRADKGPRRPGARICAPELVLREAGYAHDTGPGYAVRMLRLIADLKGSGADPTILNRAFDLGGLMMESRIKFVTMRRRSRPGGKNRGKGNADRNEEMAREFNKRRPAWSRGVKELAGKVSAEWARKNQAEPLSRNAAYDAIRAGIKILASLQRKPAE